MLVSGLILTLDTADTATSGIETAARRRPQITVGERDGIYLPVAVEAEGPREAEAIQHWLGALPGVLHVDVVSVQFVETDAGSTVTRPSAFARASTDKSDTLSHPMGYLFSGVWPSPATATFAYSNARDINGIAVPSLVSAPEDGRTPLNTYPMGEGRAEGAFLGVAESFTPKLTLNS